MDETGRREIVEIAVGESIDVYAMADECRENVAERHFTLQHQLETYVRAKISQYIERARTKLRLYHQGLDFRAAYYSIAAQTLGDIAYTFQNKNPTMPGKQALEALQTADIPPLRADIEVPDDLDMQEEIRSMIANRLTIKAMSQYERQHTTVIDDPESALYFELCRAVDSALEAEGL